MLARQVQPPLNTALHRSLADAGAFLVAQRLAWGKSGNLSGRLDSDTMLVSASGGGLGDLTADDLVPVRLADGTWDGPRAPSKEVPMHAAIYRARPDAHVVLHASPECTTLLACSAENLPSGLFIESMYYLERVAWVDFHPPGSTELGAAVGAAAVSADVILLRNHGAIVFDTSLPEAIMRLQTLEFAARLLLTARGAGIPLQAVADEQVRDFLRSGRYKPRKPWH